MFQEAKPEWKTERDTLRTLLTKEEYEAARGSTLNAHYTSPDVIRGIYDALDHLGFNGGLALEPAAGVGHFIGLVPDKAAPKTAWTAVELDPISGRIAKALYGGAEINVHGFEELKRPSNYYDLAISNVPFGNYNITEKPYGSHPIHDFFFVKSLDKVRPGGVVAFVTSRYTMDRVDEGTRRLLSKSADLVGAIRLPGGKSGAFAGNAGTEVTTDILFLRKKVPGETPFPAAPWLELKEIETPDGPVKINEYFADRPQMMLGEMRLQGTMYRENEPVLVGKPEALREKIATAAANMPAGAFLPRGTSPPPETISSYDMPGSVKDGAFFMKGDRLYRNRRGEGAEQQLPKDDHDRVKHLVGIRDIVNDLLDAQLKPGKHDPEAIRKKLRAAYDAFVRAHGPINRETRVVTSRLGPNGEPITITRVPNLAKFRPDPDAWKVAAIERYDAETDTAKPADIQTKDVIEPPRERQINGPADALAASLDAKGAVDLDHIAEGLGLDSHEAVVHALGDLIYLDPDGRQWQTADRYLSGDVVKKLEDARIIAKEDKTYERNVAALEKVQPLPLGRHDIFVSFGAPWVPPSHYEAFFKEVLGAQSAKVERVPITGEFKVSLGSLGRDAYSKYGNDRVEPVQIARAAINSRQITVFDKQPDGSSVINTKATEDARVRTEALKEAFSGDLDAGGGWVWRDDSRAQELEAIYNRTYNNLVPRKFDGSHLTFPGLNRDFATRQHRKDAVWRMVQQGNTLLAHVVGSGKTVTMIAGGMEMKRLGIINKPGFVVPNHMLEQFSREFIQAYPNARILVASKDETSAENRKAFVAKVATNDWDGVIITHDAFGRLNMGKEFRKNFIGEQLDELDRTIDAAMEEDKRSPTVKELEKARKRLEEKLKKLLNEERKDEGITFEETGIDHLFVDEAHKFKNLSFITRLTRVKGLANSASQRAEDLFLKMRYLEGKRPSRSAVFATGTPVSNTMAELWTMMRYLQLDRLKERDLDIFDSWASTFGRVQSNMELSADGRTLKEVASFSRFVNIPELISLYSEIADTKTADMLNLPRPEVRTRSGAPGVEIVQADPSSQEEAFIQELVKLAESMKGRKPKPGEPNMLSVVTMGRKVATDGRLIATNYDFNPQGKIAKAVSNIYDIWKNGKEPGLVQMVFLDMGVPQTRAKAKPGQLEVTEEGSLGEDLANQSRFDLYADIKQRLIEKGIPAKEIAAIHDADNDDKKARLFKAVRAGKVRVILGSSEKMGVGTNVQDRLIAMHHIDAPWKPAEVEQRDGRIVRQGNQNKQVQIYRYVTRRSFDAFMWQTLDRKSKFIGQVLSGAKGSRHADDIDNPLPEAAEIKAAASGDPRILEHAEVDRVVRALEAQRRAFQNARSSATWEMKTATSRIEQYEKALPNAKADAGRVQDLSGDKFKVELGGKTYTDRREAGGAVLTRFLALNAHEFFQPKLFDIGAMSGFKMKLKVQAVYEGGDGYVLRGQFSLEGKDHYAGINDLVLNKQTDPIGFMRRYENLLTAIRGERARLELGIKTERENVKRLEAALKETWPKEEEYRRALDKREQLERALSGKEEQPSRISDAVVERLYKEAPEAFRQAKPENEPMAQEIAAKPGANTARLAKLLGPKLYGDPADLTTVSVKEMFQNAFDAIKGAIDRGEMKKGKIDIEVDPKTRTVTVSDNGTGMAPEVLAKQFLEIAGTHKETDRASGGLGIAKMLFLFGNERLKVVTVRDGTRATLDTTGEQIFAALEDPGKAPVVKVDKATRLMGLGSAKSGTSVEVTVPKNYKDPSTGEVKEIDFPSHELYFDVLKRSPLFTDIDVSFNGKKLDNIGSTFKASDYTQFANVNFDWGTARIYVAKKPWEAHGYNLHVLSNGLWQFSNRLQKNPFEPFGDPIKRAFYVDVSPKVRPEDSGYPFDLNRQGFAKRAKDDFGKIFAYMSALYRQVEDAGAAKSFGQFQYLENRDGKVTATKPEALEPAAATMRNAATNINEGDKVSVQDGKLVVNGREIPELTKADLEERSPLEDLKVDQSLIDPTKVMLHDNIDVTAGLLRRQRPLIEVAREKFGDRLDEFAYGMGALFRSMRDQVAKAMDYPDLAKEAIGISFDTEYRGVSTLVPFKGMFLNIAAPEYADPKMAAVGMVGTMVHELAHHKVRSHDANFPAEMQRILIHLETAKDFDFGKFKQYAIDIVEKYHDVFSYLYRVMHDGSTSPRGIRFKDAGSEQARDAGSLGDLEQSRPAPGGGPELSGGPRAGADDLGRVEGYPGVPGEDQGPVEQARETTEARETGPSDSGLGFAQPARRDTRAAEFLRELAANDDLFQYPRSAARSLPEVMGEIDPQVSFLAARREHGETVYFFQPARGRPFEVYERGGKVWIDVSGLEEGSGGNAIYAAVANYAYNTGKVFIGDPAGLSDVALRRRAEAMLSSALKFGTTRHLEPHPNQIDGYASLGVPPLRWRAGDDLANIQSLIEVSTQSVAHYVPEIRNAYYDFDTRTFRTGEGDPITARTLRQWALRPGGGRAASAGDRTLKRGILQNTLLRGARGEGRDELLVRLIREQNQHVTGTPLAGAFYAPTSGRSIPGRNSTDLGPFPQRPGVAIAKQAQDYVVTRGRETGDEHIVAIDDAGAVVAHLRGTPGRIDFSPELEELLRDDGQSVVAHHNHPGNIGLSSEDIGMLAYPGLSGVWAHGHEGHVARASLTPQARRSLQKKYPKADTAAQSLGLLARATVMEFYGPFQKAVSSGLLSKEEAWAATVHAANMALARAGILDHRDNADVKHIIDKFGLEPYIERAARQAAGSLFQDARTTTGQGDLAEPLRHPGDVGASFGGTAPDAGEPVSRPANRRGGRLDRAERAGQLRLPGLGGPLSELAAIEEALQDPNRSDRARLETRAQELRDAAARDGLILREPENPYKAPPFYSAVARAVDSAKQEKAAPNHWLGTIKNTAGVKPEEIEWLGLEDWLRSHKGPVTKQALADYIRANNIQVTEVMKGGEKDVRNAYDRANRIMADEHPSLVGAEFDFDHPERQRQYFTAWDAALARANAENTSAPTKYPGYQLPGGENYRELLLTLPRSRTRDWAAINARGRVVRHFRTREQAEGFARTQLGDGARVEQSLVPSRDEFTHHHWPDDLNVVAHVRFNDRVIDGKRTLLAEEVQSDWHQAGRQRGYISPAARTALEAEYSALQDRYAAHREEYDSIDDRLGDLIGEDLKIGLEWSGNLDVNRDAGAIRQHMPGFGRRERRNAEIEARRAEIRKEIAALEARKAELRQIEQTPQGQADKTRYRELEHQLVYAVPDAPFKTTWPELVLKRLIRHAAENGYDQLAWTPGQVQVERYDLSKHLSEVQWHNVDGDLRATDHRGRVVIHEVVPEEELSQHIGKEAADRLVNSPTRKSSNGKVHYLTGLDLKVGGEGMLGFYDQILPAAANKIGKKYGAKVGKAQMPTQHVQKGLMTQEEWDRFRTEPQNAETQAVHTLPITAELRKAAVQQGFALFQGENPYEAPRTTEEGFVLRLPFKERWGDPRFNPEDKQRALNRLEEIQTMPVREVPWSEILEARRDINEIFAQLYYYKSDMAEERIRGQSEVWSYMYEKRGGKQSHAITADPEPEKNPEVFEIARAGKNAIEHLLRSRRRGVLNLLSYDHEKEPGPRGGPGPEPERIGETQRSGFYFLAGRKLAEVPNALFPQGGWAVINWLRQAGVKQAEIDHFQLGEKLGNKRSTTREEFKRALAERMFDFRRKTAWLNPERSKADYELGDTRAFRGPRIPGRGLYFERLMAFPGRLKGGEPLAAGSFDSPHWEGKGTWASWRGSLRDVPGYGRMIVGEEGQSDFMQGAHGFEPKRPRISDKEYIALKAERGRYEKVMLEASTLARSGLAHIPWMTRSNFVSDLVPAEGHKELDRDAWDKRLTDAMVAVRDLEVRDVAPPSWHNIDDAIKSLEKLSDLRTSNEQFFAPGARAKYKLTEATFTPESPIDKSYVRTMVRDLLLLASKEKADSVAIATSATTDRIQANTFKSAAHFYDNQLKPALERELRRLTGDSSITLTELTLPKAMGAPRNEKPYTVWAAKVPALREATAQGLALFQDENPYRGVHQTGADIKQISIGKLAKRDPGYWGRGFYMFPYDYAKAWGERSSLGLNYAFGWDSQRSMLVSVDAKKPFVIENIPSVQRQVPEGHYKAHGFSVAEGFRGNFEELAQYGWPYKGPPVHAWNKIDAEHMERVQARAAEIEKGGLGRLDAFRQALDELKRPPELEQEGQRKLAAQFTAALRKAGYDLVLIKNEGEPPYEMVAIAPGTIRPTFGGRSMWPRAKGEDLGLSQGKNPYRLGLSSGGSGPYGRTGTGGRTGTAGGPGAGTTTDGGGSGSTAAGGSGGATPPPGGSATATAAPPPGGEDAILRRIVPSEKPDILPKDLDAIYTGLKDDLHPINVVERELSGGRRLPTEVSPYKLARLTRGSYGKAEQFLKYGTFDYDTLANNGPSLTTILEPVRKNLDSFRAYAVARRAIELAGRGIKTGVPVDAARDVVAAGERFRPTFEALTAYQNRLLDYMQASGILSADGVTAMRDANKDYVPFFRFMGRDKEFGHQLGGGLKTRNPIKGIRGSERAIVDPIESIVKNTYLFISLAERNRALRALEDLAEGSTIGKDYMARVKQKMHPFNVTAEEINRHLREEGITEEVSDTMTVFRPNAFRPAPDEIAIWRDGKRRIYKVGQELAEAVNALDRDALDLITRILSVPAKMLRAGAVLAPEFIARNPVRDQFSAVAFSENGYIPVYDLVRGLGHLLKKDAVYQDWLKGGGANAALVALDRDYISQNIIKLTKPSLLQRGAQIASSPIELLRILSETLENASRLGEFGRAREAGKTPMTGAFESRELTLDFARMGAKTKSINALIPFWNAQVEGIDRGARAFRNNPFRTLLKVGLSITLPSILLWLMNHDDERYKELPKWEKDIFWHIITDNWVNISEKEAASVPNSHKRKVGDQWMQNKGTIWKIPKPFELGVLFGSVPERVLDAFFTDNPHAFKDLHKSVWHAFMPNWIPQVAIPFIEQFANRSTFTDRSLVPKYLESILPKYQAQPFTTETAQVLGNLISKINENTSFASPIVIENFIRQWTGGLGMHALNLVDKGLEASGIATPKVSPSPTLADMPVIKGFVSRYPSANSESVQQFYDEYERRKRARATITHLGKTGRPEAAAAEREDRLITNADTIQQAMANQFRFIRGVYRDTKMTPREKRQIIDATYLQVIELAKRGNAIFERTARTPRQIRDERARQPAVAQ